MKGVVVQIGEPKSIVLLNSGKIVAIPTPQKARVGMEVTVKMSRRFKVIASLAFAAVFLAVILAIGALFLNSEHAKHKRHINRTEQSESDYSYKKGIEKKQEILRQLPPTDSTDDE